ncbi:MAG: hypothetical protein OHK0031_19370 [Anaerolineales bacterium]
MADSLFMFKRALNFLLPVMILLAGLKPAGSARAADAPPPAPDRFTSLTVDIVLHEWWLSAWKDNSVACSFWVEHDGLPFDDDVASFCGQDLYQQWKAQSEACHEQDTSLCKGYYWIAVRDKPSQKEIPLALPNAKVWVSLENCAPDSAGWCTTQPRLILTAEEPLPDYAISRIAGLAGADPFQCEGARCEFQLSQTRAEGVALQFWAYSTYGDTSPIFTANLRVISTENDENSVLPRWYVDVLSSQWTGKPNASCSQAWQSFPPPEGLPLWLTTPDSPDKLASNLPYAYLAGNLIAQGAVDVEACVDGGLLPDGSVSDCGMQAARPVVAEWQNRFDTLIFAVAQETEVPAQLLKNLFSRESQFWPGVFRAGTDVGLGQLTEDGADTTLLWNPSFYKQFCPLILGDTTCASAGYANLKASQQALLRGALIHSVDATCQNCPLGIDLTRADFSVSVFARTLLANCEQTGRILQNVTGKPAGQTASYADLWRFTLVNYNAGPGCLGDALQTAAPAAQNALTWENVSAAFSPACKSTIPYVEAIAPPAGP